jgi:high affinity Mn2+ porin
MQRNILALLVLINFISLSVTAQQLDTLQEEKVNCHFQATVITQYKPGFQAKYSGANSLSPKEETQSTITSTLYAGAKLWKGATMFLNPEISGGSGLSSTLGVADATNGEAFRVGSTAPAIYLARLYARQVFAIGNGKEYQSSDFNQLAGYMPTKYFSVTVGKISLTDFFDDNGYSHDPRTQFLSWGLMDNGAWDYAANTRGYTPSVVLEYVTPKNELRYAISLLPLTANGNDMNWDIGQSNSNSLEFTHHYKAHKGRPGTIRLLSYLNTTNMGNYDASIALNPTAPDITATRKFGNVKYGFAVNMEEELTDDAGFFARASWNDGHTETWAFTEVDQSISVGLSVKGTKWKRVNDNVGLAFVTSGASESHRTYLKDGGYGFMLGDGNLNYGLEHLTEFYYSAEVVKNSIYLTGAYQFIVNPGYNKDRGPVNVFSVRVHARI